MLKKRKKQNNLFTGVNLHENKYATDTELPSQHPLINFGQLNTFFLSLSLALQGGRRERERYTYQMCVTQYILFRIQFKNDFCGYISIQYDSTLNV